MDKEGCIQPIQEDHTPIGGKYNNKVKVGILPTGLHYDSAAMVFTHLNWKPINQKCGRIDCNAMAYHMCDYKMFDGRIFSGCKRPMCLDHAVVAISK